MESLEVEKCITGMSFVNDWATWRKTVKDAIAQARNIMGFYEERSSIIFLTTSIPETTPINLS